MIILVTEVFIQVLEGTAFFICLYNQKPQVEKLLLMRVKSKRSW